MPDFDAVKKYWINGQLDYYSRSSAKNREGVELLRRIADILLYLGMASVFAAIVITKFNLHTFVSVTTVLIASLPFLAGLVETYTDRSTMSETADEHSRMKSIFENAYKLWGEDKKSNTDIIIELARESLRENADWLLLHFQIPEKMPLG